MECSLERVNGIPPPAPGRIGSLSDLSLISLSIYLSLQIGGLYGNVFRIKPPMCITKADVDFSIDVLDKCFSKL